MSCHVLIIIVIQLGDPIVKRDLLHTLDATSDIYNIATLTVVEGLDVVAGYIEKYFYVLLLVRRDQPSYLGTF